jgi:serine/threonine-protein phosphatase 2B regulatory subunit
MIPEIVMNPLSSRIVSMFEKDADGRINFRNFVKELSYLNEKRTPTQRAERAYSACESESVRVCYHHLMPAARPPSTPRLHPAGTFHLFDIDGDGWITEGDLHKLLGMMTGTSLTEERRGELVKRTIERADQDGDGRLSLEDFLTSMASYPWASFTVPVKGSSRMEYFAAMDKDGSGPTAFAQE